MDNMIRVIMKKTKELDEKKI